MIPLTERYRITHQKAIYQLPLTVCIILDDKYIIIKLLYALIILFIKLKVANIYAKKLNQTTKATLTS